MPDAAGRRPRRVRTTVAAVLGLAVVVAVAAYVWRDDILRTALDPRVPFQTYTPPPAPDYANRRAWALLPPRPAADGDAPAMDVFFVHPTTYDGGGEWNAAYDARDAGLRLERVMLPNHAGPYQAVGRVFAPRFRQASLYTRLTLRDDAREARTFAYRDVRDAFRTYVARWGGERPLLVAGVEQGGELAARLLREEIASNPALRARLVAAHLTETIVPANGVGLPVCAAKAQAGCVLAFASEREGETGEAQRMLARSLVWDGAGHLTNLSGEAACVNPVTGVAGTAAPASAHRGGANATGLEWGARPGFLPRQVTTRCEGGVLFVSRPESPSLRPGWGWAERRRAPAFNLFYADLEADARARLEAGGFPKRAEPITRSIAIRGSPIYRIDR